MEIRVPPLGYSSFCATVKNSFEYDPNNWQEIFAFRDSVTRRTPSDVAPSMSNDQGIYTYTPPQQTFGSVGLPAAY
jgi:hypothetical protein